MTRAGPGVLGRGPTGATMRGGTACEGLGVIGRGPITEVQLKAEKLMMLQRQQASAIVAARQTIVEGAVGMVEMALDALSARKIVTLDDERKASMVSNLLVVLCSDRAAQPVVNTGTLYS